MWALFLFPPVGIGPLNPDGYTAVSLQEVTSISPVAAIKSDLQIKLLFIGRIVVLIAAATLLLRLSGRRWADAGLRKVKPLRFLLAIPLGLATAFAISFAAEVAVAKLGIQGTPADDWYSALRDNLDLYLFYLIPVTWGTAAFGEEMLFRGFYLDALQRLFGSSGAIGTTIAVIAQAVIFGLLHLYQGASANAAAGTSLACAGAPARRPGRPYRHAGSRKPRDRPCPSHSPISP
jgi:membrane protease YdiL (CAAX protease family)